MLRMARGNTFFNGLRRNAHLNLTDLKKSSGGGGSSAAAAPKPQQGINSDVPGLSSKCVKPASGPVGRPGASATGEYKVPEYFCYSKTSYAEAEIEMLKYRCPQPSALVK